MEPSSGVDLDSLLESLSCEIDSDEELAQSPNFHHRTVDEIILSHSSSSSPSPPSSPSTSYSTRLPFKDKFDGSSTNPKLLDSHSDSVKFNSSTAAPVAVLPQLFGSGVIRSNAKPGAALAAAAAASRSIPTPYATAIKLRRATADSIQRSSEGTSKTVADVDSGVASEAATYLDEFGSDGDRISESRVDDFNFEQLSVETTNLDVVEEHTLGGDRLSENSDKVAGDTSCTDVDEENKNLGVEKDEECVGEILESYSASSVENEKGVVLGEISTEEKVWSADESSENDELTRSISNLDVVDGEGIITQGEVIKPDENENDASSQVETADVIEEVVKPLDWAEEIEKKQAFTGLHYAEGAAAQPMRLEGVQRSHTPLGYFDISSNNAISRTISSQAYRRDHGSPQVVAVHLNYIAVGMSKGSIFIEPSKYTPHYVDNMDAKMTLLGLQGDRLHVPVTSMCFNQQGDILFAGYGDGHYTVWDVPKASALKVVTEHKAPVVHMLYLGQDNQVTRQFNVVSGDSKGVVKLIHFSVVPWLNRISYTKSKTLLDETTSRVVCASPLPCADAHGGSIMSSLSGGAVPSSSSNSTTGGMVDEGVVVFITHQSALVAKLNPNVEVYAQIPKPDGVREGALPYAAWRNVSQLPLLSNEKYPVETLDKASLLAIAWDRNIQVAKLFKSKLKLLEKWTLENTAIGLAWFGDEMLAVLTLTSQLCLFAKDGRLIHQTSFSMDGFRDDDLISYHIYFTNSFGHTEKAYHNSVAVRGTNIYILGSEHFIVSRLLSWKERIEVLRKAGDWMGALNMGMALYDGQSNDAIDLPQSLDDIQMIVLPYLVELLQAYVSEVFSYLSVACFNQNEKMEPSDEIKEQYTRVGGVAVEFCIHIKRTDILFDDILSKFDDARHKETFLELLEPYILKDMLGSLPPAVMQALVEHYSQKGWLQRIEQCVLHMDILSLDFNQVVLLCRKHGLHCALIYLFNKGLDDFRTPLEELLLVYRNSTREDAYSIGYRMLVYLKYCFLGLAFPPGRGDLQPTRLPSLKKELLDFLLEDSNAPTNSWTITKLAASGTHVNLFHLLELDTEATLEVLKCAFAAVELSKQDHSSDESTNSSIESIECKKLVQKIVDILADFLDASCIQRDDPTCCENIKSWPSNENIYHIYDFIAYLVTCELANVSKGILSQILEYLTSEINTSDIGSVEKAKTFKRREKQLLSLLKVVPEAHWDATSLLHWSEKAQFHQVCGYIFSITCQYVDAMDCYIKVTNEPVHAFSFIDDSLRQLTKEEFDAFESAVISRIPDLVKLSREGTYFLVNSHLSGKTQFVLSELRSYPESYYLYLKTAIEVNTSGTFDLSCFENVDIFYFPRAKFQPQSTDAEAYIEAISSFRKNLHNNRVTLLTEETTEEYFELLCRFDPGSVLKFLETSESYRVEHCLRLCQEYGIVDAASFLLERVGEIGTALRLYLSNLSQKFVLLDAEMQKTFACNTVDNLKSLQKKKVVAEMFDIMHACIGLCQRNSPRLRPEESEQLWFQLLDSFCEPFIDSGKMKVKEAGSVNESKDEQDTGFRWNISKYHKGAHVIRKLMSIFIKEIVDGMIGYVRLPRIMLKLLSDNGSQEFGDFKLTILGMLGTYNFERRILDTAKSLIEDDTYYILKLLRMGASHGYAPRSPVCCICNSLLAKNPSHPSIQVFTCGHAMHLNCELEESETSSSGTLVGCPICIPQTKAQRSSGKAILAENGLVNRSSPRIQQRQGTLSLHPHDHETADNAYGSHQSSRFEILTDLEKGEKLIQIEKIPQLRLAPPALYHEKIKKGIDIPTRESSSKASTAQKTSSRLLREMKLMKGSSVRLPLKSSIFGKEKISKK